MKQPNDYIEDHEIIRSLSFAHRRDILLVDDSDFNLFTLSEMIKSKFGLTFQVAYNGLEALTLIEEGWQFRLILMDINMPLMDGFEAS